MLSLWESLWPTLGKQSPQHVISLTKTWKTKLILWPRLGKPSLEPSISCLLYDKNFESSESWEIQLHDQDIMDSQALNDSCLWPKLDKQVMMENPTLREKSKITSPGEMCFLTITWRRSLEAFNCMTKTSHWETNSMNKPWIRQFWITRIFVTRWGIGMSKNPIH